MTTYATRSRFYTGCRRPKIGPRQYQLLAETGEPALAGPYLIGSDAIASTPNRAGRPSHT